MVIAPSAVVSFYFLLLNQTTVCLFKFQTLSEDKKQKNQKTYGCKINNITDNTSCSNCGAHQ